MHINTLNAVTHIAEGWYRFQMTSRFTVPVTLWLFQMGVNQSGRHDNAACLFCCSVRAPRAIVLSQQQRLLPDHIDTIAI